MAELKLETPVTLANAGTVKAPGSTGGGLMQVLVQLQDPPIATQTFASQADRLAYLAKINKAQSDLLARVQGAGSVDVLGSTTIVLNSLLLEVDKAALVALAGDAQVSKMNSVVNYPLALSETVPYIGASTVQGNGHDGSGVKVAVIDSGIDYTHANLGGSGNVSDFMNNDPTVIEPGTFPTAKVIGGWDFIGNQWTGTGAGRWLTPDPDPLDDGPGRGHGTHVADIIAGTKGVAPGASLIALKVCSSITSSCSGAGLILAMEYVTDPNKDGDTSDHIDIVNMSLGSSYGQAFDDDLTQAVEHATRVGVLTVAAAGNDGDRPFISSTPAAARTAISVAQTAVPSSVMPLMIVLSPVPSVYPTVFQPWSAPLTSPIQGPVQYGNGVGGNKDGCAAYAPASLTGKLVFVDRGTCTFASKIRNIQDAGGVLGIIGLIDSSDPFEGGFDNGSAITIPAYMVSKATGNVLRKGNAVVKFDPASGVPLVKSVVGSSARGPRFDDMIVKPEIGAPGASVSALAGQGTAVGVFGGTSGATPMVAGSAALLLHVNSGLTPVELKALLMNNGYTQIVNKPPFTALAPITRIGGGEVRVDKASTAPAAAWVDGEGTSALSFGFVEVDKATVTLLKSVRVRNYTAKPITYNLQGQFRFADDQSSGAVQLMYPASVKVQPASDKVVVVQLKIDGTKLGGNPMSSGSGGADAAALTKAEYDGYLVFDDGQQPIHMPWHVVPRRAARLNADHFKLAPLTYPAAESIALSNAGIGAAQNDTYSLIAYSGNLPQGPAGAASPTPDLRAVGVQTYLVSAKTCSSQFLWAFAVNSWERKTHLLPVEYDVYLDTNQDGQYEYVVFNSDASYLVNGSFDGRQLTWVWDLSTGAAQAWFFAEHATATGNTVLFLCGEQVGLSGADILSTPVGVGVQAWDFYFGGPGDLLGFDSNWALGQIAITPLGEQYLGLTQDVAGLQKGQLDVYTFPPVPGTTPDLGMLLVTNGDRGTNMHGGATSDTETLLFSAPGVSLPKKGPVLDLSYGPGMSHRYNPGSGL